MTENKLEFPELSFDEMAHTYRLNGIPVPGVSEIMEPLTGAHYGGIDDDTLTRAASRGTAIHHAIENWLAFGIDDAPPEYLGYYEAFKAWFKNEQPDFVLSERKVYHKILRYAGTVDLLCDIRGETTLIDIKTSPKVAEMLVRVQLEAYARALSSHGINASVKSVLHLKKDGGCELVKLPSPDTEAYECFCGLLTLKNYLLKKGLA